MSPSQKFEGRKTPSSYKQAAQCRRCGGTYDAAAGGCDRCMASQDPMRPGAGLLVKLGSIAVHADEALSVDGHDFDLAAFRQLIIDPEVAAWLSAMDAMAMLPKKRNVT